MADRRLADGKGNPAAPDHNPSPGRAGQFALLTAGVGVLSGLAAAVPAANQQAADNPSPIEARKFFTPVPTVTQQVDVYDPAAPAPRTIPQPPRPPAAAPAGVVIPPPPTPTPATTPTPTAAPRPTPTPTPRSTPTPTPRPRPSPTPTLHSTPTPSPPRGG